MLERDLPGVQAQRRCVHGEGLRLADLAIGQIGGVTDDRLALINVRCRWLKFRRVSESKLLAHFLDVLVRRGVKRGFAGGVGKSDLA
jgi:hypothetical protein